MTRPRLLLADDHEDLLHEVTALLEGEFEVIGVARDGMALVDIAAHLNPDVVITDFKMPGLSGIDASQQAAGAGFVQGGCAPHHVRGPAIGGWRASSRHSGVRAEGKSRRGSDSGNL